MLRISLLEDGNAWPSTIQLINDLADTIEAQEAEIERLREALRSISMRKTGGVFGPGQIRAEHRAMIIEARAALGETE